MDFLKYNRDALEQAKIVVFGEEGHAVVNFTKLSMLLVGAIRQLGDRVCYLETGRYPDSTPQLNYSEMDE